MSQGNQMHMHESAMGLFQTSKFKVQPYVDISGKPWGKQCGFQRDECFDLGSANSVFPNYSDQCFLSPSLFICTMKQ